MKDVQAAGEANSPQQRISSSSKHEFSSHFSSVAAPDPYVFGPPGSGTISTRYGSGSFFEAKIVRKLLLSTVL
jgi:hypothetical protein